MRKVAQFEDAKHAEIFRWYLFSRNIETRVEDLEHSDCDVWVIHDHDIQPAKHLYEKFVSGDVNQQYIREVELGKRKWQELRQTLASKEPRQIKARTQIFASSQSLAGKPTTLFFMGISILFFLSHFVDRQQTLYRLFLISTDMFAYMQGYASFKEILDGQFWRLITPIFIHTQFFHILFNMMWLYQLGALIEQKESSKNLAILILVIAIPSNCVFYYFVSPIFGGMSGVVYGLYFYMYYYDMWADRPRFYLNESLWKFFMFFYVFCWFLTAVGVPVANTVHGFGAATGVGAAFVATKGWERMQRFTNTNGLYSFLIGCSLLVGGVVADTWMR